MVVDIALLFGSLFPRPASGAKTYPPVIGGKNAISPAPSMRASARTWLLSMAARITFGFSNA
jgi:hypothetical protein